MKSKNYILEKRILAGAMAGMMIFTPGVPVMKQLGAGLQNVYADQSQDEMWRYSIQADGTIELQWYYGEETEVVIPAEIDGMKVTRIGTCAFQALTKITSIIIPDSVKEISNNAFEFCSGLTTIEIPSGVTAIGMRAFAGCSKLKSIVIPDGITEIVLD